MSKTLNISLPSGADRATSGRPGSEAAPDDLATVEARHERSYERESAVYDARRFETPGGTLEAELQERTILDLVRPVPGARVLDVAAGTGRITEILVRSGAEVHAVDLAAGMLSRMRDRLRRSGLAEPGAARANARLLPFRDDTFDTVVSIRFLHLIPWRFQRLYLEELARVMKPGGRLLVEFGNVFFGGPLGVVYHLLGKAWRGEKMAGRLLPHRERTLFRGFQVLDRVGSIYPGAGKVAKVSRSRAIEFRRAWYRFPLNHLTLTFMVLFTK